MFCTKCYSELDVADADRRCPKCGRPFDPAKPDTFLLRPFPSVTTIVGHVVATTLLASLAAYLVAFHQMVPVSGH